MAVQEPFYVEFPDSCGKSSFVDFGNGVCAAVSEVCLRGSGTAYDQDATVAVESEPAFMGNLAHALSLCCLKETVPITTAECIQAVFPAAGYMSINLPVLPHVLISIENMTRQGHCVLTFLHEANSLAGSTFKSKRMMSSTKSLKKTGGLMDLEHVAEHWATENYLCVPLLLEDEQHLLQAAVTCSTTLHGACSTRVDGTCHPALIVEQFARLSELGRPCVGVMTFGIAPGAQFSARQLANACLLACAVSKHVAADWSNFLEIANHPVCGLLLQQQPQDQDYSQQHHFESKFAEGPGSQPSSADMYRVHADLQTTTCTIGSSESSETTCSSVETGSESDDEYYTSDGDDYEGVEQDMEFDTFPELPPLEDIDSEEGQGDNFSAGVDSHPMDLDNDSSIHYGSVSGKDKQDGSGGSTSCKEEQFARPREESDSDDEFDGDLQPPPSSGTSNDAVSSNGKYKSNTSTDGANSGTTHCQYPPSRQHSMYRAVSTECRLQAYFGERSGWSDWRATVVRCLVIFQLLFVFPGTSVAASVLTSAGWASFLPWLVTLGIAVASFPFKVSDARDPMMVVVEVLHTGVMGWVVVHGAEVTSGDVHEVMIRLKTNLLVALLGMLRELPVVASLYRVSVWHMLTAAVVVFVNTMQQLVLPCLLVLTNMWPEAGSLAFPVMMVTYFTECQARRAFLKARVQQ